MHSKHLPIWVAPEDLQAGEKLIEQIDRSIQVNDRLLLVLSEHSMNSEWVRWEIQQARARRNQPRTELFPIGLGLAIKPRRGDP